MNDLQWHRARQTCLGASEIRTLLGLGYEGESPARLYAEKVAAEPVVAPPTERQRTGLELEPVIARRFEEHTGLFLLQPRERLSRHPRHPWIGASLDRLALGPRPVELKAVFGPPSEEWGAPGTDQVPDRVLVQVQQQCAVAGSDQACVAALFVGYEFRVYTVPFDPGLFAMLAEIGAAFWRHVERREPVPEDWSHPLAGEVVGRVRRIDPGTLVRLGHAEADLATQYTALGEVIQEAERDRGTIKARLQEAMGTAALGLLPDGRLLERREVSRKGFTVEPTTFQSFKVKKSPKRKALQS